MISFGLGIVERKLMFFDHYVWASVFPVSCHLIYIPGPIMIWTRTWVVSKVSHMSLLCIHD